LILINRDKNLLSSILKHVYPELVSRFTGLRGDGNMPDDNVNTLLAEDLSLRLDHGIFLGVVTQYLESDVELVRIVDGDHPLVSSLILKVEVQLDREDKNGDLPVQD